MTSTPARPTGSSNLDSEHRTQAGSGRFMLTLCSLAAPVSIRPPQSPQLKSFRFFMSRACEPDGSKRLYLHMGYFDTLGDAERWAESVRRHYPSAFATIAPPAFLPLSDPEAPAFLSGALRPAVPTTSDSAPIKHASLTDTQVLRILETRRANTVHDDVAAQNCDQIALLGPDDTATRQVLKEAVAQGAPVSFAVQLQWSAEPIDLSRVRAHAVFKAYTLYATERHRNGHARYFLRLGFFADPISAKQVAVQVCSNFASAAVVPVVEPEITRARAAGSGASIPYLEEHRDDRQSDSNGTARSQREAEPLVGAPGRTARGVKAVEQTREPLAKREMLAEPDPLSESGVRHLRVEVQEHLSGRWKVIRLRPTPSGTMEVYS